MHIVNVALTDVRAIRAAKALIKAGCTVYIVDVESRNVPSYEDIDGIHLQHMPVPNTFAATRFKRWAFFRAAGLLLRGIPYLLRTPADVYHALDLPALTACYIASKLRRKPLIFDSYELPLSTLPTSEMSIGRRLLHVLLALLLSHIIPRCAGVIATSLPIVEEMSKRYPGSNIQLVRNIQPYRTTVKSDRIGRYLGLKPETRIALYQGNLQPDRGLHNLVRAATFLEENIVIVMMGKDMVGTQAHLESLIADEGLADRVKIISSVPYEELLDWTASADIGLVVYAPDYSPNVRMMLPNKLFEYLMAGLPVLSSELDAIAEVIKTYDIGNVVRSLAPKDVSAAINTMLADHDSLAYMSSNALVAVKREFNWEKESQRLLHLYDDVSGIVSRKANELTNDLSRSWKANAETEHQPFLILVDGFRGSGKTTLLQGLQQELGFVIISGDQMRQKLLDANFLSQRTEETVNSATAQLIQKACSMNISFSIDRKAKPEKIAMIKNFLKINEHTNYTVLSIFLKASEGVLKKRVIRRTQISKPYSEALTNLGINLSHLQNIDENIYDLVIQTDYVSKESILQKVVEKIKLSS